MTTNSMCGAGWGRFCLFGRVLLMCVMVLSAVGCGSEGGIGSSSGAGGGGERVWEKVIYECIAKVEKTEAVFYRRGERVTGKEIARQMRDYLRFIQRKRTIPEPFGRNAGITLAVITTHEGIARDGLTGPPEPFEIEVNGHRMKVYDWLKQELGLGTLPGEEEGHEVLLPLYEAVVTPELLKRWEEYLDRCIEATARAEGATFHWGDFVFSAKEAAGLFASNKVEALRWLKAPNIKHPEERDRYRVDILLLQLTSLPLPRPESYRDQVEYTREVNRWFRAWKKFVEENGRQEDMIDWLLRKAGEPPPMPTLRKKGKRG
ncbi:hypothetical protein G4L39_05870 [Limisphaera ngatamarikiensis]|uniref:Uncharacterized protein n=1 Tax=Limisphaera ngatamarikiensis TaxID=1324935 RepID=A0A6M1RMK8_9BACT|nr:hypothetical protein [Limisphaera ngatamarikiensis]NGO38923.1 hypothetical protein [Limisphaera ngatamarikiensis]